MSHVLCFAFFVVKHGLPNQTCTQQVFVRTRSVPRPCVWGPSGFSDPNGGMSALQKLPFWGGTDEMTRKINKTNDGITHRATLSRGVWNSLRNANFTCGLGRGASHGDISLTVLQLKEQRGEAGNRACSGQPPPLRSAPRLPAGSPWNRGLAAGGLCHSVTSY